jgi:hypothetical protein
MFIHPKKGIKRLETRKIKGSLFIPLSLSPSNTKKKKKRKKKKRKKE